MNLIPRLRTEEEKKNFQVPEKSFPEEIAEKMEVVASMSDEELQTIVDTYQVSHKDYAMQQAASRTLRCRKNARDTRTVKQQYIDAPESIWH